MARMATKHTTGVREGSVVQPGGVFQPVNPLQLHRCLLGQTTWDYCEVIAAAV